MHLNLFGRRRASEKPTASAPPSKTKSPIHRHDSPSTAQVTIDSLSKMRETIKNLEKREQFLETKANTQLEEALAKNKAGDKKAAVAAMTRKKLYDAEVVKLGQMRTNIEAQMLSLESANINLVAHEGMQAGLNAQRQVAKSVNVEGVAEMQQEIEDHLNDIDEVSRILANPHNAGEVYDPDELLAELNSEMEQLAGSSREQSSSVKAPSEAPQAKNREDDLEELQRLMENMPSVPTGEVEAVQVPDKALKYSESDRDLLRLQAEMGI